MFVSWGIPHAMSMRHSVICGLHRSTVLFHIISLTERFSKTSSGTQNVFLFSLQFLSETFLILRRNLRDMIEMYIGLHVKYPLFLSDFNETWIFSADFRKNPKHQIPCKPVPWKPNCSMRADGRTDMTKLIVAFRNFANASKNLKKYIYFFLPPPMPPHVLLNFVVCPLAVA
jgi:hypothetical protein